MVQRMKLKFENPPINELVIGAYFAQPIGLLRSEHVGLFWAAIRKEFPKTQQQPELMLPMTPNMQFQINFDAFPMPRFWFISEDNTILLQIQKNAFILNWRKQSSAYPHFDKVKSDFDHYFSKYLSFLSEELQILTPTELIFDLTYTNIIEAGEFWTDASDTKNLLPSISIPDPGIPTEGKPDFNFLTAYKLAVDLGLNVSIRSARKASDPESPVLVFELRALSTLGATTIHEKDPWFDRAHDTIGRCFTAMTNPDIQNRYWKLV